MKGRAERMSVSNERTRYFVPHEIVAMRRTAVALARLRRQPRTWLSDAIIGAAFTGLRLGNFAALTCGDIRRDERDDLYLFVGREKNGKAIEKRLLGELRGIVERRLKGRTPAAILFPGPHDGTAANVMGIYLREVVRHVGKRHPDWKLHWGIKGDGVTFHSFRHAMASLALNAGVPMDTVQKMGNWKTPSMVRVYARRADESIRAGEDALASVLQLHTTSQSPKSGSKTSEPAPAVSA
jgi:integrase